MQLLDATKFDHRPVLSALGGDFQSYREIAELFLADLPAQLTVIARHWGPADSHLADALHSVGSACGAVGAVAAEKRVRAAEAQMSGQFNMPKKDLEQILELLESSRSTLKHLLDLPRSDQ